MKNIICMRLNGRREYDLRWPHYAIHFQIAVAIVIEKF